MDVPGVRFVLDDRELIKCLHDPVDGRTLRAINEGIDAYSCRPENLPNVSGDGSFSYYYTNRVARNRSTDDGSGYWKSKGDQEKIRDENDDLIGFKRKLSFYLGRSGSNSNTTHWIMEEYTLKRDRDTSHGTRKAICKIHNAARNQKDKIGQASTSNEKNKQLSNYTNVADALKGLADDLDLDYELSPEFNNTNMPHF